MSPRSIAKSDRVPRSAPARLSAASILRVGSESLASVFVLCKDSFFVRLISSVAPADCPAACERADWSVLAPARRVFGRFKIFLSRSYSGLRPVHQGWVRDFRSPQVESSRPGRFRRPRAQVCSAPRFSRRACKGFVTDSRTGAFPIFPFGFCAPPSRFVAAGISRFPLVGFVCCLGYSPAPPGFGPVQSSAPSPVQLPPPVGVREPRIPRRRRVQALSCPPPIFGLCHRRLRIRSHGCRVSLQPLVAQSTSSLC
jgi:hypothetical protein